MQLELFKSLWGYSGTIEAVAAQAVSSGLAGLEGSADKSPLFLEQLAVALHDSKLGFIQEIVTAGDYVPRRDAMVEEHLADVRRQMLLGKTMLAPRFVTVIGGCDAWTLEQSVRFFADTMEYAEQLNMQCCFETHRSRSLFNPWATLAILQRIPELRLTCDFSHWVVVMERLLDDDWDVVLQVAQHAHHIHARVGYPQGPQVPHPAAPEYEAALRSHQRCWEAIWTAQRNGNYSSTTMTPEFGPDGYLHTMPFSAQPVADLGQVNEWMAQTERVHFAYWKHISPRP